MNQAATNALLLLFVLSWRHSAGQVYFNEPLNHFGGTNNQAYLDWLATSDSSYNASFFLPSTDVNSTDGAAVHWTIRNDALHLAVAVRASGWLGFGLAEVGGMEGADMILFEAAEPDQITDAHVLRDLYPIADACQNWNLVKSHVDRDFLVVEVSRALDTGDAQDRIIIRDDDVGVPVHLVIAAWGNTTTVGYHGDSRVRGAVRWFRFGADEQIAFKEAMAPKSNGSFDILANNYTLAPVETEYMHFCLSWNQILEQGIPNVETITAIAMEPVIDPRATAYVHHFTLYGGKQTIEGLNCEDIVDMTELLYVWAPGEPALTLPDSVGTTFGEGSYKSLRLEIHYNNPDLLANVVDNSGVRLYYTTSRRQYEMGMTQVGDPGVALYGQIVGAGLTGHTFDCPSSCTQTFLPAPVTVLRESLHMHKTGVAMQSLIIRTDQVVHTARVDYWNVHQQGNPAVKQTPYQLLPGDSFRTVCNYQTDESRVFGLGSSEEMCIAFFMYYPKLPTGSDMGMACGPNMFEINETCLATYSTRNLTSENDLDRSFGKEPASCPVASQAPSASPAANAEVVQNSSSDNTKKVAVGVVVSAAVLAMLVRF